MPETSLPLAGLSRRLAAALYDALLVAALWMPVTLIYVALRGGSAVAPGDPFLQFTLLATAAGFFVHFWSRSGQTLGMQTWRLRVELRGGAAVPPSVALLRFAVALVSLACAGLGFFWQLVDSDQLTWHDRVAGTRVVIVPKR